MPAKFKPILDGDDETPPIKIEKPVTKPAVGRPTQPVVEPVKIELKPEPVTEKKKIVKKKVSRTLPDELIIKITTLPANYPPKFFKPY